MFKVIVQLLSTKNPVQAKSALHGLRHIRHPKGKKAIDQYLVQNPEIDEELKRYALQCQEDKGGRRPFHIVKRCFTL